MNLILNIKFILKLVYLVLLQKGYATTNNKFFFVSRHTGLTLLSYRTKPANKIKLPHRRGGGTALLRYVQRNG
jgi:hypothetical protein